MPEHKSKSSPPVNVKSAAWSPKGSDTELMEAVIEGDPDALAAIYHRYKAHLRAVTLSVLHEVTDAEDVLQDVFVTLWKDAERYLPEKGLRAYLGTIARRRALDRLRRVQAYRRATDRLEVHLSQELRHRERSIPRAFTNLDLEGLMSDLIGQLPAAQQEVVRLTFYEGLSHSEIAGQKSIPLGTVKARLKLARKKLLNRLVAIGETI
jgi:RNA polymerase sigma-70 factor (ECF subfamily)